MKTKLLLSKVVAGLFLMTVSVAARAQILWQNPVSISGDADVLLNGSVVAAYNFGGGDSDHYTVSGVNFVSVRQAGVAGAIAFSPSTNVSSNGSAFGTGALFNSLSAGYQGILKSALYSDDKDNKLLQTVTLSGLTTGATYQLQIWVNDNRSYGNTRSEFFSSSGGVDSVPLTFNQGSEGTLGNYLVGIFTADATGSQSFSITSQQSAHINALTLSVIPEPSTWTLLLTGAALLAAVRTKRAKYFFE